MTVYAVWTLASDSYAIKFHKNDGSGKWRSVGYKYGVKTRMPSLKNGLGWSRSGYIFKGWATSAANAANGIVWKGDWAYVATGVSKGATKNVYAVWVKSYSAYAVRNAKDLPISPCVQAVLLPGYYSGELADGMGMYDLLVDEGGKTGYVNITFNDGAMLTWEVDVAILGDIIIVADGNRILYELVRP